MTPSGGKQVADPVVFANTCCAFYNDTNAYMRRTQAIICVFGVDVGDKALGAQSGHPHLVPEDQVVEFRCWDRHIPV